MPEHAICRGTRLRVDQFVMEFSLRGGIESVAFELHHALRAAGIDSRIVTSVADEDSPEVERIASSLSHIPTRGGWRHVGRALVVPLYTLAAAFHLQRLRHHSTGGVVLSHGDTWSGDVCVVHAVNRANIDTKRAAGNWRWVLNPLHHWVSLRDRIGIGGLRFRRYVALSRRIAQELQRYYGVPSERIVIIPNGVNLDRHAPEPNDRIATRRELGIPPGTVVLLFVGHEFERKGLAHAIDALAALGEEFGEAVLAVAGAGHAAPFERQARQLGVQDRVKFMGPRQDLPRLYRAADAFVFPTAYESFALTCMEAMACGLPVFATAAGGIEDYLRDGVNGRIVVPDGNRIAEALTPMLRNTALREQLREGALATAAAYGWGSIAERYRDLLAEVAEEIAAEASPSRTRAVSTIKSSISGSVGEDTAPCN